MTSEVSNCQAPGGAMRARRCSEPVHRGGGAPAHRRLAIRCHERGFTLIEIIVVVVVIAILATLVAPNVFQHVSTAKETTARSQIEMLGTALDAFKLHVGRYPTTAEGLDALWTKSPSMPASWRGPYLRKAVPLDPWGNPYQYRSPGEASRAAYDLVSFGADGRSGGEGENSDVVSW